jgi:hypothetical protein
VINLVFPFDSIPDFKGITQIKSIKKDMWLDILLKAYGSVKDPRYLEDVVSIKFGKFSSLNIFKKNRNIMLDAISSGKITKVYATLDKFMKPFMNFVNTPKVTQGLRMTFNKNIRMEIKAEWYTLFLEIVANYLMYVPLIAHNILNYDIKFLRKI